MCMNLIEKLIARLNLKGEKSDSEGQKQRSTISLSLSLTRTLCDCLSPRGEGGGDQRGGEALHHGTGPSVWGARHPLQLHPHSHRQE